MNNQNRKSLYSRGSEWRRWNLQVQPIKNEWLGDLENKKAEIKNATREYLKKAIEKEISVIGITDHNTGIAIDSAYEILEEDNFNIYVLPGVELETPEGWHCLVLFNLTYKETVGCGNWNDTIQAFLRNVGGMTGRFFNDNGTARQVEIHTKDLIREVVTKNIGIFVFSHCDSDKGFFHRGNNTTRKEILEENLRGQLPFVLDTKGEGIKEIENEIKNVINDPNYILAIPVITTSDAHHPQELGRFTWIKSDPTFEGLKQILYEPELRIKIQQEDPRENETYTRIEKCVINFPSFLKIQTEEFGKKTDFCMQGKYELGFSNNLTCIIGGRGSGKSTLVHLLYNTWTKKDIVKLDELNSPLLSLDLTPNPLKQAAELTTTEIPADTEFFLQNEIEKFARDVDEMSGIIRHRLLRLSSLDNQIILKDLQDEWLVASRSMNELMEAYDNVSATIQRIESIKKQIETLKKQTAVIKSKEYKSFQKEIEDINEKISAFRRYKSEYTRIVDEIDVLITAISQLNWNEEQGKGTLNELAGSLRDYKEKLRQTFSLLESKFGANDYFGLLIAKKLQLKKYLSKKGLAEENIEELAYASEQIKELEDEIRSLERQKAPFEEIYNREDSILSDYEEKYSAYHDRFFEVAARLQKELDGLPFFDKEISFIPKINEQRLREAAVEFVKESSPAKVTLRIDDIQSALFDVDDIIEYLKDKEKIRTCVNQTDKTFLHKQVLQELVNNQVFLEKLYLRLWRDYYDIGNIQVQIKLGDKLLQNTSFGERCGIVISIVLVAGTNPIVVDQPEDNLDGKFISNVLVPLIRKRKLSRQIILVTRDANIVIGGDAELIHILESDEKKTKIVPSTIENIEHREKYIWILDGGKDAFLKRERKYSI